MCDILEMGIGTVPRLEFIGHAGYIVDAGEVRLLVDPWTKGSAFDNGWDMLLPAAAFDPATITHLWMSHEHPDHFSVPSLLAIPAERRAQIGVLFQETADKRVVDFLRKSGFARVREVGAGERIELARGVAITTIPMSGIGDSAHLLEVGSFRMINFNDCFYDTLGQVEQVLQQMRVQPGTVDLLLTQFSYANWVGNPDQPERRRAWARHKLAHLAQQLRAVKPRFAMPFASYVYFSHEDNLYLNDSSNPASRAAEAVRDAGVVPLLMRPGDIVELSSEGLSSAASQVQARGAELDAALLAAQRGEKPSRSSKPVGLDDLVSAILGGLRRLQTGLSRADALITRLQLPRARFLLRDQPFIVQIDRLDRLSLLAADSGEVSDVTVSSEALRFAFSNDFGFDTLLVNGRFVESRPGGAVVVMKLCGQFGHLRRRHSILRAAVERRLFKPRLFVERLRGRALVG